MILEMECGICTVNYKLKYTKYTCPNCKQYWCGTCHENILKNNYNLYWEQGKAVKIFKCPYCRRIFVFKSKILAPNKKLSTCNIM